MPAAETTPAAKAAALIRDRKLSPVEYVDVVLKAIDRAQPKLNCFRVVMAEEARRNSRGVLVISHEQAAGAGFDHRLWLEDGRLSRR